MVTKWFDNKSVCIASSFVGAEPSGNCKHWDSKLKKHIDVVRLLCIAECNKFTGGVDLSGMLIELYRMDTHGKKWYMPYTFNYFLDVSVVNALFFYQRHMGQHGRTHKKSLLDFKSETANYLTSANNGTPGYRRRPLRHQDCSTPKRPKLVKPKPYDSIRYDGIQHWPEEVADKTRCQLCSTYARIQCSKCKVSLCLVQNRNCFKIFHTQ